MNEKHISVFIRLYRILLSTSVIAAGLCLIYGCLTIYYSGPKPYTHQSVATAFNTICVPVYICLGLIVLGMVLSLLPIPFSSDKKPAKDYKNRVMLLKGKKDFTVCSDEKVAEIKAEGKKRRIISIIRWGLTAVCAAVFLVYALNPSNFDTTEINTSVINAMIVLAPCLSGMLIVSILADVLSVKSIKAEIELLKDLPSLKSAEDTETADNKADKILLALRCVILVIAVGILIYGFLTGGIHDVLTKAVNICTECIGLG